MLFQCVNICTDYAKAKVDKTAGTSVIIKVEAANGASNPIPHNHTLARKKGVSFSNVLDETININCIKCMKQYI